MKKGTAFSILLLLVANLAFANINQTLREAAEKGDLQTVIAMLDQGGQIDARSAYGTTPLMAAAYAGKIEIVKLLVEKGAAVNAIDNNGESALMTAAGKGRYSVVEYLLSNAADIKLKNSSSADVLHRAANAPKRNRLNLVRLLVEKGCDPGTKDKNDHTPLMDAALNGDLDTVKFLIENGADYRVKDISGKTAKDYAMLFGFSNQAEVVKYLEGLGAK